MVPQSVLESREEHNREVTADKMTENCADEMVFFAQPPLFLIPPPPPPHKSMLLQECSENIDSIFAKSEFGGFEKVFHRLVIILTCSFAMVLFIILLAAFIRR